MRWPVALLATFAVYSWLVIEWSPVVRLDEDLNRNFHVRSWWPMLHVLDRIGQRAVCLPVLAAVIALVGWRHRSWRPVLPGVVGVAGVTLLVLIAKVTLGRGVPLSGESFFSGGDLYPSGHTANVALAYGLSYYLATRYLIVAAGTRRVLMAVLGLISVVMFGTSLLLRWHWFSDLVAGFLIGGAVLALTISLDIALSHQPLLGGESASAAGAGARARSCRLGLEAESSDSLVDLEHDERHDNGCACTSGHL